MARAILRQTFIALRARRQAYRIAADFLYDEPIDVESFPCSACGQPIHVEEVNAVGNLPCPSCGTWNRAPAHLRSRRTPNLTDVPHSPPAEWVVTIEEARRRQVIAILMLVLFFVLLIACLVAEAYTRTNGKIGP